MNETIYTLLLWALPVLLGILAFIGSLAVNSLIKMSNDLNDIKVMLKGISVRHDELEKRVCKLEIANGQ